MNGKKKTGRVWYFVLAGVVACGGLAGFVYLLYTGLTGITDSLIRIEAPSVREIKLEQTGKYTVFLETPGVVDGTIADSFNGINGLSVRVETLVGGEIKVGPASGSSTYSIGGRHGVSLMEFVIKTPGRYKFIISFAEGTKPHPVVLTLMQNFLWKLLRIIITGITTLMGTVLVSVLILIVAFTRGQKDKKPSLPGIPPPIG